ncbi:tetratricopeptide repeat protein [Flavivirga amylovorans]|uniref:Tetratricopeptide repeat protein n=1 Tax=Flavivirga amylovorans TaxID=870486 RepID=A0ABT8X272_9FLAO|nr:tetratricopeptide repeat protein [Flavivirga amylovorans]MDO5988011.1 tetratricopeptide repeat protein [Flavivirga amylovorans]
MKATFYIVITVLTFNLSFAQNQKYIDSLKNEYNTMPDTYKKVQTSARLFYAEVYTNPKAGFNHALQAIELSKKIKYESGETVSYFHLGVYYDLVHNIDSSEYYYNKTLKLAKKYNDNVMQSKSLSVLAGIALERGDFELAITLRNKATEKFIKNKDYLSYGVNVGNKAIIYSEKGDYKAAIKESLLALNILDTIDREPYRKADINIQIGDIEIRRKNYYEAIDYYNKALKVYIELNDNIYTSNTYINLGSTYIDIDNKVKAKKYLEKGLKIARTYEIKDNIYKALTSLSKIYSDEGLFDKAVSYLRESEQLSKTENNSTDYLYVITEIGSVLCKKGNYNEGVKYLDLAIKKSDSLDSKYQLKIAYDERAKAFEKIGLPNKALADIRNFITVSDEIDNISISKEIEELKTIYKTEKKEAAIALQQEEIKTLNEKAKVDKLTKGLYSGGMFSFIAVSGLLFFGFQQRIKKNRIAREKQEEIYKQEIAFKQRELTSQTLHLVQKNTFIQELKENLEKIKKSPELFKVEFRRLVMLLKKQNAEDKDWEVFKSYFSEVHNNFDNKLKTIYTDISEKEIRLASFLRMNLSTKEIASMLNVLPESVLKSKYRLKKKLDLDKETDLNHFLNNL